MNQEALEAISGWSILVLIIAAVCTTLFPIVYFFSWRRTPIGWIIMLQSIAFALAMDLTLFFQVVQPRPEHFHDVILLFVLNALVLTMIAGTSLALTIMVWRLNHPEKEKRHARRRSPFRRNKG